MKDFTVTDLTPIFKAYAEDLVVDALVGEASGNGHQVFIFGTHAYLPNSQVAPGNQVEAGERIRVCVIKIMPETNSVIVSARVAAEKKAASFADNLEVGQILTARIKSLTPFGAFASIGEVDGLIHITELSYNQISSPSDVVSVGDEVKVKVIRIYEDEKGKLRVELSLKQTQDNPMESIPFKEGDTVEGTVTKIEDYGAFLSIGKVSALLHRSEITWETDYPTVRNQVSIGEKLTVMVKTIDRKTNRIAVSLRDVSGNLWDQSEFSQGDIIEIGVLKHSPSGSGLIVGQMGGIQGVLPRKEMAWSKDEAKSYEASVQDGDTIQVAIIEFDKQKRKMVVSRKPLLENPADVFIREHPVGSVVEGEVVKNLPPGIIKISLPPGEFRIAFDHSFLDHWYDMMRRFPIGGKLPVRIEAYEPDSKKITFMPAI